MLITGGLFKETGRAEDGAEQRRPQSRFVIFIDVRAISLNECTA